MFLGQLEDWIKQYLNRLDKFRTSHYFIWFQSCILNFSHQTILVIRQSSRFFRYDFWLHWSSLPYWYVQNEKWVHQFSSCSLFFRMHFTQMDGWTHMCTDAQTQPDSSPVQLSTDNVLFEAYRKVSHINWSTWF